VHHGRAADCDLLALDETPVGSDPVVDEERRKLPIAEGEQLAGAGEHMGVGGRRDAVELAVGRDALDLRVLEIGRAHVAVAVPERAPASRRTPCSMPCPRNPCPDVPVTGFAPLRT